MTGEQVLAELGDLVSPPDAEVLSGEYAEFVAGELREALRSGIWGWFDDDVAILGDWAFDLGRIDVPVRIWHGREDRFVPVSHGEWLAEHVAGATAHILDGPRPPLARARALRRDPRRPARGDLNRRPTDPGSYLALAASRRPPPCRDPTVLGQQPAASAHSARLTECRLARDEHN